MAKNTSGLKRGGSPGRPAGVPNKANAGLKAAAQVYTEESLQTLVDIMRQTTASEQARISAAREILDRGHGKAAQALELPPPSGDQTTRVAFVVLGG